jgi:hypothetical protein
MAHAVVRRLAWASILAVASLAHAQTGDTSPPAASADRAESQPAQALSGPSEDELRQFDLESNLPEPSLLDRLRATMTQQEDPNGPINTDRPTFTPANTVVPRGRLQFESGFTYDRRGNSASGSSAYDLPELAVRYGLTSRVELRTFWLGETFLQRQVRRGGSSRASGVPSSMEAGFKWQLFAGDRERKWIPTTALITSIIAPTGGDSSQSPGTVEPYINLIYGWSPNDKLTLCGSTGYLGMHVPAAAGSRAAGDNFQRYHQSLVGFYSATKRTTLFYEWYIWTFTNAADNRPANFMDGGLLYRLTANIQLDLRAGFGLSGRPDEFFTGAGMSVRF